MPTSIRRTLLARARSGLAAIAAAAALALPIHASGADAGTLTRIHTGERNTATFLFSGEIVQGDLARLQEATAKVPGQRMVLLLESSGGSINEGLALGRHIHASNMTTVAIQGPGCHSACTFMFLAGRTAPGQVARIMIKGARVGFHQGGITVPSGQTFTAADVQAATGIGQDIVRRVNTFFSEIKADPEFLTLFLSAPHNSITLLNEIDALRLGVHVMDPTTQRLLQPGELSRQAQAQR